MSKLYNQQTVFAVNVARLILWAHTRAYEITLGEAYRTATQSKLNADKGIGISNSLHQIRLAIDLNLFVGGKYKAFTEDHRPLGEYWKSLHPLNRWGGDFHPKPDGNHYAMEYDGRK